MAKIYQKSAHQEVLASPLALKCFSEMGLEIILLSLKKGETIPMHKNPVDVLFFVKSGKGELQVEQDVYTLCETELAFVSQTEDRSWINYEEEPLELVVMKMLK